jgi:hypothetical protein
LGTV